MGCHTWCYKKVPTDIEAARASYLKDIQRSIESFQRMINDPDDSVRLRFGWSIESCKHTLELLQRQRRMVEKGLCEVAVLNRFGYWIPGKGLYQDSGYHDVFRVGHYPDDHLFSYQECIDFIAKYEQKHNCKIKLWHPEGQEKNSLQRFWEEHPDGHIHFG